MSYMNWTTDQFSDPEKTNDGWALKSKLGISSNLLFNEYKSQNRAKNGTQQTYVEIPSYPYGRNKFVKTTGLTSSNKSKLQKYLEEELDTSANLNILDWWKINSCRFPIL